MHITRNAMWANHASSVSCYCPASLPAIILHTRNVCIMPPNLCKCFSLIADTTEYFDCRAVHMHKKYVTSIYVYIYIYIYIYIC